METVNESLSLQMLYYKPNQFIHSVKLFLRSSMYGENRKQGLVLTRCTIPLLSQKDKLNRLIHSSAKLSFRLAALRPNLSRHCVDCIEHRSIANPMTEFIRRDLLDV